jgi:hypothetical protein
MLMDMKHLRIQLTDIPDEILLLILTKLSNIEVLYSLIGVNIRLDKIASDPIFTDHLSLLKRSSNGVINSLDDSLFDRLYSEILPTIRHKIKCDVRNESCNRTESQKMDVRKRNYRVFGMKI